MFVCQTLSNVSSSSSSFFFYSSPFLFFLSFLPEFLILLSLSLPMADSWAQLIGSEPSSLSAAAPNLLCSGTNLKYLASNKSRVKRTKSWEVEKVDSVCPNCWLLLLLSMYCWVSATGEIGYIIGWISVGYSVVYSVGTSGSLTSYCGSFEAACSCWAYACSAKNYLNYSSVFASDSVCLIYSFSSGWVVVSYIFYSSTWFYCIYCCCYIK